MLINESYADIKVPGAEGVMRLHMFRPVWGNSGGAVASLPGVLCFSEIYQVTGPMQRLCRLLAGKGYIVGAPEVYHEYEPPGTILAYDTVGTDRGNELKVAKACSGFDAD